LTRKRRKDGRLILDEMKREEGERRRAIERGERNGLDREGK